MKLDHALIRLPLSVDVAPLVAEVSALPESAWRSHPDGYPGNSAALLISQNGDPADDRTFGEMAPTPLLRACPALAGLLAGLGCELGRTRLMRLDPGAEVAEHVDARPYWWAHLRLHVPILTHPEVRFYCGYESAHMAAGELWIFDTWRPHRVVNGGPGPRVHLVCDTVGSPELWRLIRGARTLAPEPLRPADGPLMLEHWRTPRVLPPDELRGAIRFLFEEEPLRCTRGQEHMEGPLRATLEGLHRAWAALYAQHGESEPTAFAELRDRTARTLRRFRGLYRLKNTLDPVQVLESAVLDEAVPERAPRALPPPTPRFLRPVITLSPPRSGSSLLFEALTQLPGVYSVGRESHQVIEGLPALDPANRGFDSGALGPELAGEGPRLRERFFAELRDRDQRVPEGDTPLRMVEKTPKNCLRVPFLDAVFPDACYVVLLRSPRDTLSSLLDGWRSGRFVTYPRLPGWRGPPWSFLLVPGWRALNGAPLWQIVAAQWRGAVEGLLSGLAPVEPQRVVALRYEALVDSPQASLDRLCAKFGLEPAVFPDRLPLSANTLDPPDPEKWTRNRAEVELALSTLGQTLAELEAAAARWGAV